MEGLNRKKIIDRGIKTRINLNGRELANWRDYFKTLFKTTKKYDRIEEGIHWWTIMEKYDPFVKRDKTEIKIGYLNKYYGLFFEQINRCAIEFYFLSF
jgi:hypothetical protein